MIIKTVLPLRKKTLALLIGCVMSGSVVYAQDLQDVEVDSPLEIEGTEDATTLEEVVVYGVRASQAKSIDIKRNATNIVDSIIAEDIGKLPDITITDSLQRITGVQISREANEGTSLNVRGMPQVLTTLNGEQFLSPWSITGVGANYSDVPAGVISGVDVHKSMSANLLAGGISGLVDLKTFRPTALKEGWTVNTRAEASMGTRSHKEIQSDGTYEPRSPDHNLNLFVSYNQDGRYGASLGLFDSSSYAANYQIYEDQRLAFLDARGGTPTDPLDLDKDGDTVNDWYMVPNEFGARSNFMDRDRKGASFSIEAEINDHFQVRGDIFYTRMDQYDRGVKAGFNGRSSVWAYQEEGRYLLPNNNGEYDIRSSPVVYYTDSQIAPTDGSTPLPTLQNAQRAVDALIDEERYDVLQPGSLVGPGAEIQYIDINGVEQTRTLHTLELAEVWAPDFQSTSTSEINRTAAINSNFELLYTNNDNFSGSVRVIYAEADKQYRKATFQQGTPAWLWIDVDNDGKDKLNSFNVSVDYRGEIPSFSYEADLSNPDVLQQYQGFADGRNTSATLTVARADGQFTFTNSAIWESVDFGFRHGIRDAENENFYYVTPTGRYSSWNDPRVSSDKQYRLRSGNAIWQKYPEWLRFNYDDTDPNLIITGGLQDNGFDRSDTIAFSQFGPIKGFEGGISALNPAQWDNPLAFLNRLYPGAKSVADPGFTYAVKETSNSIYGNMNFNSSDGVLGIPFSGSFGVRVISTEREVEKTIIPEVLDKFNSIGYDDWQRIAFVSTKEILKHSFTDVLPSLNINLFPADDLVVRFAASRTTSRNDLTNVGSSQVLWYQQCPKTDENGERITVRDANGNVIQENVSCVGGGDDRGRIDVKPWYANVYNTSMEWYFSENAILGAGLFLIDVDTSVEELQEQRPFLDGDGIYRDHYANIWTTKNATGTDLIGFELGYKQPFSFLDNTFLAATGVEFNYTFSDSEGKETDIQGHKYPLKSNSEHQANFILWYDKNGFNARLAYNWRSKEYLGQVGLNTNETVVSLGQWLKPTGYLDFSASYQINDSLSVFASGTNLTEQHRISYAQFEEQFHSLWAQERRYALGLSLSL